VRKQFSDAAHHEEEHLAWTRRRLSELSDRPSLLNPLWYGGAFAIGIVAGAASDQVNPGLVAGPGGQEGEASRGPHPGPHGTVAPRRCEEPRDRRANAR